MILKHLNNTAFLGNMVFMVSRMICTQDLDHGLPMWRKNVQMLLTLCSFRLILYFLLLCNGTSMTKVRKLSDNGARSWWGLSHWSRQVQFFVFFRPSKRPFIYKFMCGGFESHERGFPQVLCSLWVSLCHRWTTNKMTKIRAALIFFPHPNLAWISHPIYLYKSVC